MITGPPMTDRWLPTRIEDMAATVLIACIVALTLLSTFLLWQSSISKGASLIHRHDCPRCGRENWHPVGSKHAGYCFHCHEWTAENGA